MFLIHNPGCSTNYMTEYIQSVPLITRYTGCPTNYMTAERRLIKISKSETNSARGAFRVGNNVPLAPGKIRVSRIESMDSF